MIVDFGMGTLIVEICFECFFQETRNQGIKFLITASKDRGVLFEIKANCPAAAYECPNNG